MMKEQIEKFREWLMEDEKSDNTIDSYTRTVEIFFSEFPCLTKQNMIAFKRSQIEKWKPKTAANRCTAMNQYCKFAGKPECRVKGVKIHKQMSVENVISREQYEKLLGCLKADGNEKGYWMVKYLAKTGCRASEFIRLDKKCLDTGVCTMWTKGKIRKILIPSTLIEESREYFQAVDGNYLFPPARGNRPMMTTRGLADSIRRWAKKYGIPGEVAHPHSFRHLYAIESLKHGMNITLLSDLLGHESVDTTAIYLRLSAKEQAKQFNDASDW